MTGLSSQTTATKSSKDDTKTELSQLPSQTEPQQTTTSDVKVSISNLDERYRGKFGVPPVVNCEFCGAELATEGIVIPPFGHTLWNPQANPCTCEKGMAAYEAHQRVLEDEKARRKQEEIAEQIRRKRDNCGMNMRQRMSALDALKETPMNKRALAVARRYAAGFEKLLQPGEHTKTGLYIHGPVGTGKSCIAAAVTNAVLDLNRSATFTTMIQFQNELKRTFSGAGSESDVMDAYKRVKLLVIDDLGKEQPSEWNLSRLFEIVDARNGNFMPMIVTSNYNFDQLADRLTPSGKDDQTTARAIVDRLTEACVVLEVGGKSQRA